MKTTVTRELLYSIARHSTCSAGGIAAAFRRAGIYAGPRRWAAFLRLLLLGAGVSFVAAGVVFFFAYNWADMHKFVKLGLLEALLVLLTAVVLFANIPRSIQNILLTGNTVLVGVLFAVFGQIYQTGANAFDFFLGWTCCVALWVAVARYAPLWLLFLALANTTLMLYTQQVATHWPGILLPDLLFLLNGVAVLVWELVARQRQRAKWLQRVLALAAVSALTVSLIIAIYSGVMEDRGLCLLLAAVGYAAGIWQGRRVRDLFYLSVIPFSGILVGASLLVRVADKGPEMFLLLATLFIIGSTTLLVRHIIRINHKWHG